MYIASSPGHILCIDCIAVSAQILHQYHIESNIHAHSPTVTLRTDEVRRVILHSLPLCVTLLRRHPRPSSEVPSGMIPLLDVDLSTDSGRDEVATISLRLVRKRS